jgi:hypothetical protein
VGATPPYQLQAAIEHPAQVKKEAFSPDFQVKSPPFDYSQKFRIFFLTNGKQSYIMTKLFRQHAYMAA